MLKQEVIMSLKIETKPTVSQPTHETKTSSSQTSLENPPIQEIKKAKDPTLAPAGYYDAHKKMSIDVTERRQSMAVLKGPEEGGMPTYSGPHFSEFRNADPKNILGSGDLHPKLVSRVERLVENANRHGMNLYVHQGHRSMEEQMRLLESGRGVTQARPGYSFHNYGLAVDIVFQGKNGQPSWSENHDWKKLGKLGKEVGLEWGGDWKSMKDRPHFQLIPNNEISTVRKDFHEGGLKKVWENIP